MPGVSYLQAYDHESALSIDNTAGGIGLTPSKYLSVPQAKTATITVETAQIRWTKDGTAPTTLIGHLANVGSVIQLDNPGDISRFRAIRTGASSGALEVTYSR